MTAAFSDAELDRYARHIVLPEFGARGQARLKAARVAVVGAGGIGCPALLYLAAAGAGAISLFDDDRVERSNLQRQILFGDADIGRLKVEVARERLLAINPHVVIAARAARLGGDGVGDALKGHDVIIDGCDNFATRLAVADAAQRLRIPLVSVAIGGFDIQVGVFRGWEGDQPCYRCLVGDAVDAPGRNCADLGLIAPVGGIAGSLAALEAMRVLAGFGDAMTGRWLVFDALTMTTRTLTLGRDPSCPLHGDHAADRAPVEAG